MKLRQRRTQVGNGEPILPLSNLSSSSTSTMTNNPSLLSTFMGQQQQQQRRRRRRRLPHQSDFINHVRIFCYCFISSCTVLLTLYMMLVFSSDKYDHISRFLPSKKDSEHKQQQQQYERIVCSDKITIGYMNDNYCDCMDDGRDEIVTSACSHVLVNQYSFHCGSGKNNTSTIIKIHASRVNDGIYDCPDKSDELYRP